MFSITVILLVVLMGSCNEDQNVNLQDHSLSSAMVIENSADQLSTLGELAAVNLGVAGNFAIHLL